MVARIISQKVQGSEGRTTAQLDDVGTTLGDTHQGAPLVVNC